jgi:hypothetical protein
MNSIQPLSNDQLFRTAPSIFAPEPWVKMSRKYQFIPTIQIVEEMRSNGFLPISVQQSNSRIPGKENFTKHLIKFIIPDGINGLKWEVGDTRPEIALINSHDGSCQYEISAGLFRKICSNGMFVSDGFSESFKTRHSGNIVNDVLEATYHVIEDFPKIGERIENFRSVDVTPQQQLIFAQAALQLKWEDIKDAPIEPKRLLEVRRPEDREPNLWCTFNRVQENLLKGGQRGLTSNKRRTRTRATKSINEDVRLNKALWTLAEKMAELA